VTPVKRYNWEDDDSVPEWFPQHEPSLKDTPREVSGVENPLEKPPTRMDSREKTPD